MTITNEQRTAILAVFHDRDIEADDCAIVADTLDETAWDDGNYGRVIDLLRALAAALRGGG